MGIEEVGIGAEQFGVDCESHSIGTDVYFESPTTKPPEERGMVTMSELP